MAIFLIALGGFALLMLFLTLITGNAAVPLLLGAIAVVLLVVVGGAARRPPAGTGSRPTRPSARCHHCGSPVQVRGERWECGWCGDHGHISSLRR